MRILRCWFCSGPVYPGHGITFVRNDSKEFVFCRGKCHKAFKHKRAPRKTKWTKTYRKMARKELSDDFAQTFERKRNTALRYSRDNLLTTLNAINSVVAIKNKRENLFVTKRLKVGVNLRKEEDKNLVKTQMHLIKAPNAAKEIEADKSDTEEISNLDVEMEDMETKMSEEASKKKTMRTKKQQLVPV